VISEAVKESMPNVEVLAVDEEAEEEEGEDKDMQRRKKEQRETAKKNPEVDLCFPLDCTFTTSCRFG
jgi:hypothetical protein